MIKKLLILLYYFFIIQILLFNSENVVNSQQPFPYNTTKGCSMYGVNSSFVEEKDFDPLSNQHISKHTCQFTHPEYSELSCCNYDQTKILKVNMEIAQTIFGRCQSCMINIYSLWCASSCSPYQRSFMVPTKVDNKTEQILEIDFYLHPHFAVGLYNSCKDVQTSGSPKFGEMYKTPMDFFKGLFSPPNNPTFQALNWIFDEKGYDAEILPCSERCSCDQCSDACIPPPSYKDLGLLNSTIPQSHLNIEIPYVTVWIVWIFLLFLLSLLLGSTAWLIFKYVIKNNYFSNRSFKIIVISILSLIFISTILIPFLSTGDVLLHDQTSCLWEMENGNQWNCTFALGIALYVIFSLLILSIVIIACIIIDKNKRLQNNNRLPLPINNRGINNSDSDSDLSPVIRSNNIQEDYDNGSSIRDNNYFREPRIQDEQFKFSNFIQKFFYWYGIKVTSKPILVLILCLVFTACIGIGIMKLRIEEDPVKLWVSPQSRSAQEKAFFDENFGPFYRVQQMIITPKDTKKYPSVLYKDLLTELITMELELMSLSTVYKGKNVTLDTLCFEPTKKGCLVESVSAYWQRSLKVLETTTNITDYFINCQSNPLLPSCMDTIGTPVLPKVVLGGWKEEAYQAKAFVVTFLLNNPNSMVDTAMAWENVWIAKVQEYTQNKTSLFYITYNAQRSVQDELSRESEADIPTIIISYSVMFLYISLALGSYYPFPRRFSSFFVRSRFALGLSGIVIVACSIIISVGICSILNIHATLIISEVIPFLVLAIGVDNIFIIVNTFESIHITRYSPSGQQINPIPEESLAKTLSQVGPSIALASLSESLAFLLGSLTNMPAVQAFSFYASIAVFFDFLLQITAFSCLLVLDCKRTQSRRIDCFPCIRLNDTENSDDEDEKKPLFNEEDENGLLEDSDALNVVDGIIPRNQQVKPIKKKSTLLQVLFKKYYAPFLMNPLVKLFVVIIFVAMLLTSINYSYQITLGLDQRIALPRDSYLQGYFTQMNKYLEVGPPMYIVSRGGYDFSNVSVQNEFCTIGGCNNNSVVNLFNGAPYITSGISSWLDDYLSWTQIQSCCYAYENGTFCNGDPSCKPCFSINDNGRPSPDLFYKYLPDFIGSPNTDQCPLAGFAYTSDVNYKDGKILASRFDGYLTPLRTQNDFINALKTVRYISDHSNMDIFSYSIVFTFFEQYLTIEQVALKTILLALAGVFLVSLVLLMNVVVALLVVISVGLCVVNLLGVMTLWNISLNAISVVNIVMGIGIAIEFSVHIAFKYIKAPDHFSRNKRVRYSISEMGSSIINGIFFTKLLGVSVLGFSNSEIFVVYYFRQYMAIIILSALHGLVLLPVLLSLINHRIFSFNKFCKKNN
ncbi:hypothetical protein DICPUDRAFT_47976 [Dictyostelium purpureum]|uniref:SSD domain-containing protein n=1 Tax=Dictyostelium purpureum TaxID=5786 RepID=F0ZM98_DICPU|nr:uncharacterized protein DICPUDRAFT_47976 [Dictyostelium purpureum]EGC34908.1 hypothetical protein DICPUDRAFT_47976 [Dictyostelium purpureum]|eukprot:XP_003288541.1 hypothetical protein DICPUDRAFT_47976 [Dictyostelium purpureum]